MNEWSSRFSCDFVVLLQLKTATLTLVLVALLIVALTSVDTVLSYISRMLLRKTS